MPCRLCTSFGAMMIFRDCCQVSCHGCKMFCELLHQSVIVPFLRVPLLESWSCDTSYYIPLQQAILASCKTIPKHYSIPGCMSRSDKEGCESVSFHTIPKDVSICHQWLVSIKKPIAIGEHTRICSTNGNRCLGCND